jgi:ferric-dicitrate binding protein FerR (iron transport regulator)
MASNPSSFQKNARSPRRRRRAIAARAPCGIRLVVVVEGRLGGSAGLSGDGAESRTGVMERRGWTGAEWGRGGAPFPGEAKGVAGPGGEEKGAGGVARRLPTSESKFHKKKHCRHWHRRTRTAHSTASKPSASAPWAVWIASLPRPPPPSRPRPRRSISSASVLQFTGGSASAYQGQIQFTCASRFDASGYRISPSPPD